MIEISEGDQRGGVVLRVGGYDSHFDLCETEKSPIIEIISAKDGVELQGRGTWSRGAPTHQAFDRRDRRAPAIRYAARLPAAWKY